MCVWVYAKGPQPPAGAAAAAAGAERSYSALCASRGVRVELLRYLDGLIFAHATPREGAVPVSVRRRGCSPAASSCETCDDSSGPAGPWEWKALLKGVAGASLHPVLLMMEPRAQLLQALPSLERAAQPVALEGVVRPG
jgi:hypothetical protein